MKRHRDISTMALSIALTMAAGWLWVTLFDWALSQGGVRSALVRYVPSLIIVGAGIGYGSVRLGAPTKAAVIGALYGWTAGTTVGFLIFELGFADRTLELALFYLVPVVTGITFGLLPALWMGHARIRRH